MTLPTVTVFIPVFNREKYVAEAIQSILDQTFTDFELLIIDDGSTDKTREVIQTFNDQRLRVYHNETNQGLQAVANNAIYLARGRYFARLDSDDVAEWNWLETLIYFLEKNPQYGIVSGGIQWFDSQSKRGSHPSETMDYGFLKIYQFFFCPLIQGSMLVRTAILREFLYQHVAIAEDYELFTRILVEHGGIVLKNKLVNVRVHDTNISLLQNKATLEAVRQIYRRHLNHLQMPYTPADLDTYLKVSGSYHDTVPMTDCRAVQQWLVRMKKHLIENALYPTETIETVFATVWYSFIQKNKSNGIAAFYLYLTQCGIKTKSISVKDNTLLFLKCVGVGNILPLLPQRFYEKMKYWYRK
jgi:hypothetical protein